MYEIDIYVYIKQLMLGEFHEGRDMGEIAFVDSLKEHILEVSCQNRIKLYFHNSSCPAWYC